MYIAWYLYSCKVQFARQPLSLDSGSKAQEHNMDTSSSEVQDTICGLESACQPSERRSSVV